MNEIKATHDLLMSPMSPTFCRRCSKSGFELSEAPCEAFDPSIVKIDIHKINPVIQPEEIARFRDMSEDL